MVRLNVVDFRIQKLLLPFSQQLWVNFLVSCVTLSFPIHKSVCSFIGYHFFIIVKNLRKSSWDYDKEGIRHIQHGNKRNDGMCTGKTSWRWNSLTLSTLSPEEMTEPWGSASPRLKSHLNTEVIRAEKAGTLRWRLLISTLPEIALPTSPRICALIYFWIWGDKNTYKEYLWAKY